MGVWGSGPRMIQGQELEEGEACYYKDDASIDPDIALSYIDDKVQSILGHFQKDFEGGVSAENLGAKFGGYGSFLPTYQRSPSLWSQPKSPEIIQNLCTTRSPNHLSPEVLPHGPVVLPDAPIQNNGNTLPGKHPLQKPKTASENGSVRRDSSSSSREVAEVFHGDHESNSCKSDNPMDQRRLKVRIKVGPDRMAQKNAAIYSGLGLTSPSSSTGNSPDGSGGIPFEIQDTSSKSPASILQIMTSFPVSGSLLLSPLHEDLLNLVREIDSSAEKEPEAEPKRRDNHFASSNRHEKDVSRVEKIASAGRSANSVKPKDEANFKDHEQKSFRMDTPECKRQAYDDTGSRPLSDGVCTGDSLKESIRRPETLVDSDKAALVKKREGSRSRMRDRTVSNDNIKNDSFESISSRSGGKYDYRESRSSSVEKVGDHGVNILQKDVSVDHGEGGRKSRGIKLPASIKTKCANSEGERASKKAMDHLCERVGQETTSVEQDRLRISYAVNNSSSEGEKRSKGSHNSGKLISKLAEDSRTVLHAAAQYKLSREKGVHRAHPKQKNVAGSNFGHADMPEKISSDGSRNPMANTAKEKQSRAHKPKEVLSDKILNDKVTSGVNVKAFPNDAVPSTTGPTAGTAQAMVAPLVIEENWVCCDLCQQWRLLPYGTKSEQLPEKWICSMLDWLPGMNHCGVSEDDTTDALHALYQVPVSESQYNPQNDAGRTLSGVNLAGVHHLDQNNRKPASDQIVDPGKRQRLKETSNTVSGDLTPPSNVRNTILSQTAKDGCLKGVNQPLAESNMQHPDKAAIVLKSKKRKDEHVMGDDDNKPRKKSKVSDSYTYKSVKKIKDESALNMDISRPPGMIVGGSGSQYKIALKDMKKQNVQKSAITRGRDNMKICVKKKKDQMQDLYPPNERELFTKKRKLKHSEDGHNYVDSQQYIGSDFQNDKVLMKEEDINIHHKKKSRVSMVQGKELSKSKGDNVSKIKDSDARILLSGNSENPPMKSIPEEQQSRKYRPKLPLQLTIDDIASLRKDLGCEDVSTAATSSSSKVSDTRRKKTNYRDVKGSPQESVSSSPIRMHYPAKVSPMRMETVRKADSKSYDVPTVGSGKKSLKDNGLVGRNLFGMGRKGEAYVFPNHPESFDDTVLDFREGDTSEKFNGKPESGRPHSEFVNTPFGDNEGGLLEGNSPFPTIMPTADHSSSKERMNKNHSSTILPQRNSRKSSTFRSMDEDRRPGFDSDRIADKACNSSTNHEILESKILREDTDVYHRYLAPSHEVLTNARNSSSDESSIKSIRENTSGRRGDSRNENQSESKEHEMADGKSSAPSNTDFTRQNPIQDLEAGCSRKKSSQIEPRSGKSQINPCQVDNQEMSYPGKPAPGSLKGSSVDSGLHNVSLVGDLSTAPDNACLANGTPNLVSHNMGDGLVANTSSHVNRKPSIIASNVLKEAQDSKDYADRLKNSGFDFECKQAYFEASMKFLQGASLLEACSVESSKHGEMNPIHMYTSAAKLWETCALEYEKRQEMAAATLAYKCMEVAYMRIVYCKTSNTNRFLHDLQSSLQIAPQGDSPSSSASDIDHLNNLVDKATLSKGNGSHAGNHVIMPRNRHNFVRLLDFTKDVNSAMEAARKSHNAFEVANLILEEAQNKEGIFSIKRVIDFSFQDVEELIRLVRIAHKAITRE